MHIDSVRYEHQKNMDGNSVCVFLKERNVERVVYMTEFEESVSKKIYYVFKKLELSPACKGYNFAMTAIVEKFKLEEEYGGRKVPIGTLYRKVGEIFKTEYRCVERNIRTLRQKMQDENDNNPFVKTVFGDKTKFSNAEFIARIYSYIKYEYEE